ncbi:phosphoglycerate mutase [Nitrosomonas ureae]|uniref:Phosphoglycerate mutase n=1 Tax=Nitrosomonas ureae TaxID=44577 RepID=A0A0S3AGP7_9PROT|nr:phosphoglycerate mutase [Nitrosomonas ureae]ALQ50224.1 phosphoglycerate mutase [Nitrosomonas ureae]SDU15377.1 hypothetical protein SAMN05216406_12847 [Nitrosomonas ureae]SEQ01171.1 hypothetical protein SAMN05421510_101523 [Nitrosomonas ureae]
MNINLLIPNLFWSDTSQPEIYNGLLIHFLETLLSKGISRTSSSLEMETWLCKQFNLEQQHGSWPIAPLMLHIDAPALAKTSKDFWMCADPVHLRIEQNHIMLADSQSFKISPEEAEQFVQDLNHNLGNSNFIFSTFHPHRWYIRIPKAPEMQTHLLSQVTCKNINNFLPTGKDSIIWHKIFNEVQMLLHEHPINQARESRGELIINSIWLGGGGGILQSIHSPYTHIWSNDDFSQSLALASSINRLNLPIDVNNWLKTKIPGNHLVVLDSLRSPAKYKNAYEWRETLKNMEHTWFIPLYTAIKSGKVSRLTITTLNEIALNDFVITRSDLWKFWLFRKPLFTHSRKTK